MNKRRLPKFLTSISAKLLIIILLAGLGINLFIIVFAGAFQHLVSGAFPAHITRYVDYLVEELGVPPSRQRAEQLAAETAMVITYEGPSGNWATGMVPAAFETRRSWLRFDDDRIQIQSKHGNHAVFVRLEEGRIGFYLVQPPRAQKKIKFLGMLLLMFISLIMLAAFLAIGWVLRPLRWLKQGVEAVGRGKLSHRVPLKRNDELRDLSKAFNDMAERLSRLIKAKEQLLLDVSHELRSPITRIKVALAMLPEDDSRQGIAEDLNEIEAKITELLETARSLGVKEELNRTGIDLGALVRRVAAPFQEVPPGVVIHPQPENASIMADGEQLAKALKNVIDNAVKYSLQDSAPIEVGVRIQAHRAVITVQDYGRGIPSEDLEFVFEPFYRVDKARSPNGKGGYGLGLSLVKTIVEAHNGTVDIESTLGQGTVVRLFFPSE